MTRISKISELPISTIETALRGTVYEPPFREVVKTKRPSVHIKKMIPMTQKVVSNPFVKMRNGFGKLMQNFNKIK